MTNDRLPLFCGIPLAERIEQAEVQLITHAAQAAHRRRGGGGFVRAIAGGVASHADDGSPFNKVAGLGFAGLPSPAALDEIEQAFAAQGLPVQVELANLGDPALATLLTGRGYRLISFENVLGRPLTDLPRSTAPDGVQVRCIEGSELLTWLAIVCEAVLHADTEGVPQHEEFSRQAIENAERDLVAVPGTRCYLAQRHGVAAAGASVRIADGIAQLGGAATLPGHRRRGIHTAMLAARLADAAAAGCEIAVVTTQPGSRSQQNVQRQGFHLLYTRSVLVKEPQRT